MVKFSSLFDKIRKIQNWMTTKELKKVKVAGKIGKRRDLKVCKVSSKRNELNKQRINCYQQCPSLKTI